MSSFMVVCSLEVSWTPLNFVRFCLWYVDSSCWFSGLMYRDIDEVTARISKRPISLFSL